MPVKKKTKPISSRRISLRATPDQALLIQRVAAKRGTTMTDFILESACAQAEMILAEENRFVLTDEQWEAFNAILERPARAIPRLQRLFSEPGVVESGR